MAHQYSRVGFKSSVEVNEVNLSLSYGGVGILDEEHKRFERGVKEAIYVCRGEKTPHQIEEASDKTNPYIGQFQVTVFSRFCYVLLCNHEYIHCLNHRQAKDYITRHNETKRKL